MRTQSAWKVEISGVALRRRLPSRTIARSFISRAALFVNVTARMRSGRIRCRISSAMRNVMTRVFPEPAPASTRSGPLRVLTASRCAGLRSAGMEPAFWAMRRFGSTAGFRRALADAANRAKHRQSDVRARRRAGVRPSVSMFGADRNRPQDTAQEADVLARSLRRPAGQESGLALI